MFSHLADIHWLQFVLVAAAAALGVGVGAVSVRRSGIGDSKEARRQWTRRLADASFDGLLVHRHGTIVQMNRALVRMLGYREVELLGTHFSNLAHPSQVTRLRTELEAPQPNTTEFTLLHADKTECFVEMASHTLQLDGLPATVTAIRNLTALRAMEARLAYLVHNDALTGLANRAMFTDKLQQALARNDSEGGTTSVLTLELEQLKAVNEQLGRSGGDKLMRQIAGRLLAMADEEDTVARLGGNQFGIVQPHTGAPNRTASLASHIEAAMQEPFIVEGKAVRVGMAIGVATYPEHATGAEALINASGFALSKSIGRGGVHVFSYNEAAAVGFGAPQPGAEKSGPAGSRTANLGDQWLARDLQTGLANGEITLEYQPLFATPKLSIAGFEALARWRHPKKGAVAPARFIPLADAAGFGPELGSFILQAACLEAVRCKTPMMAVNLSPMQFRDPQLAVDIRNTLQKTGLAPNRLEVQVTEELLMHDPEAAAAALQEIQSLGVLITLDDLGTDFASLNNLSEFPFNRVKIDKQLIHSLGEDSNAEQIVMGIISVAHGLDIEVIAEGIETEAQLQFLKENGCNFLQGYHLGRPAPQASPFLVIPTASSAAKPSLVATKQ